MLLMKLKGKGQQNKRTTRKVGIVVNCINLSTPQGKPYHPYETLQTLKGYLHGYI